MRTPTADGARRTPDARAGYLRVFELHLRAAAPRPRMTFLTFIPDTVSRHTYLYDIACRCAAPHRDKGEEDVMFYVIGWIAVGACAALVAGAKGRNPVGWLVLGAFFGLIRLKRTWLRESPEF